MGRIHNTSEQNSRMVVCAALDGRRPVQLVRCTSVTQYTIAELKEEKQQNTKNKLPAEEDGACVSKEAAAEGALPR